MGQNDLVWPTSGQGREEVTVKDAKMAIPALPMPLAFFCCILNFLLPGMGTFVAGCLSLCCARAEELRGCERLGACCLSLVIALLQLLLTAICLLGWIWSCVWGVAFLAWSAKYYQGQDSGISNSCKSGSNAVAPEKEPQVVVIPRDPPPPYGQATTTETSDSAWLSEKQGFSSPAQPLPPLKDSASRPEQESLTVETVP